MGNKNAKISKDGTVTLKNVPAAFQAAFNKAKQDGELILINQRLGGPDGPTWNQIAGPFDTLIEIWKLDVSRNMISTLPPSLPRHHGLKVIILTRNQLTEVPATIGSLKRLMVLDITYNQIAHLPREMGELPALTTLLAGNNRLADLPPELARCDKLTKLHLNSNQLKTLPDTFIRLSGSITELRLDENPMWEQLKKKPELVDVDNRNEANSTYDIAKTMAYICQGGLSNPNKPLTLIMFEKYDKDQSGSIDKYELKELCYDFGYFMSEAEVDLAFMQVDSDGSGSVSYNEFLKWWESSGPMSGMKLSEKELQVRQDAAFTFQKHDLDRGGTISADEFGGLHAEMQRRGYTGKAADLVMAEMDEDRDGEIQFNEYISWLIKAGILKK